MSLPPATAVSPASTASTASHLPRPAAQPQPDAAAASATAATPMPSDQLLQGRKAIEISHNGAVYRLQATKLGKLILTK